MSCPPATPATRNPIEEIALLLEAEGHPTEAALVRGAYPPDAVPTIEEVLRQIDAVLYADDRTDEPGSGTLRLRRLS